MLFLLLFGVSLHEAAAYANFLLLIPNGLQVDKVNQWHAVGHTSPLPDDSMPHMPFRRNGFGKDFFAAGHKWTRALCMSDSDGDGLSNGEELGDPDCIWHAGQTPARSHNITHPGVPDGPHKLQDVEAKLDLPLAFNVSGAGFAIANGVYALVTSQPEAYVWDKRLGKPYIWRHVREDCNLWYEQIGPVEWGISCNEDHVYYGGGRGPVPRKPVMVRDHDATSDVDDSNPSWQRGLAPAPELEPVKHMYTGSAPSYLPTGQPLPGSSYYGPVVFIPCAVLLAAFLAWRCSWLPPVRWRLVIFMYFWLMGGISIGSHRYFAHRTFKTGFCMKNVLGIAASMTLQDNPINWANLHRMHHRACDQELDFHSPVASNRGFWFSHAAWAITAKRHARPFTDLRVVDLLEDDDLSLFHKIHAETFIYVYLLSSVCAAMFLTMSYKSYRQSKWQPVILAFYYFGMYAMLPICFQWHSTMMVNSVDHIWGERPYVDGMLPHIDTCESRNVPWLFLFQAGENWHNNHHAAPGSARFAVHWYQIDLCFWVIRGMEVIGLVWDVRVESPAATRPGYEASKDTGDLPIALAHGCGVFAFILWKLHWHGDRRCSSMP